MNLSNSALYLDFFNGQFLLHTDLMLIEVTMTSSKTTTDSAQTTTTSSEPNSTARISTSTTDPG